jgi:general stress protein 26
MGRHETPQVTDDPKEVKKVRKLMARIDVAMVTSVSHEHEGGLVSRPLSTTVADDGDALFLIRSDSAIATDVRANPQVNLAYTKKTAWLSVSGRAEIVTDRGLVEDLWSKGAEAFMEGGPENPENVVLRVRVETAHLWGGDGVLGLAVDMVKAVADRDGEDDEDGSRIVINMK